MNIRTFFGLLIGHGWASGAVNENDGFSRHGITEKIAAIHDPLHARALPLLGYFHGHTLGITAFCKQSARSEDENTADGGIYKKGEGACAV